MLMTYEEIVLKVREGIENGDARAIFEHIAMQVNIIGEGSGAFYIEVANRQVCVEPYDYYDRDGLITSDGETLIAIAEGRTCIMDAIADNKLWFDGNPDKLNSFIRIKLR